MAFSEAMSVISSAAYEAVSLVWMELAMFGVAAVVYLSFVGIPSKGPKKKNKSGLDQMPPKIAAQDTYRKWQQAQKGNGDLPGGLYAAVTSMRELGKSKSQIESELRVALGGEASQTLFAEMEQLPATMIRDDAIDMVPVVLRLLEEFERPADAATYASLMAAQLRRRDFVAVAGTAAKLPTESLTPKMLAILATAAAGRKQLDEVLLHLGCLPVAEEGSRCALSASAAGQILMLATKEQRADEIKAELQRIGAQIRETKGVEGNQSTDVQRSMSSIKAFARNKDLPSATAVFDRLKLSGVAMRPQVYNCYLDACVQCGSTTACLKLFEEMKQLGYVDIVSYNTMLKAYLASNRMEDARALVQEMSARGLPANKVTYNEMLNAKVASRDRQGMWAVVDEMLGAGLKVNLITCSILLKSLSERSGESDVARVMALVGDLESIDEVLFSSTVEACIRIKQLGLLSQFIDSQKSKGILKKISAPIFGAMIKAFGDIGNVHQVRDLWAQMQENQVKPTAITIGCVVEALVINRRGEEAWQLVQEQLRDEDRKSMINTVVYSTVLKGVAASKRIDKVLLVYKEMRANSIACNTITYNTMLDACAKCNAMDKAAQLLEDMKALNVEPDIITYSTIIKGYCMSGEIDLAFSVMREMKSDGNIQPDEIMYNSLLDGCARQRQVTESLKILDEMRESGIRPSNYTLSILVKLLGNARRLGQALQIVEDLSKQHGLRPNIQVYTCMIHACFQNKRFERALSVYETMIQEGCRADEKFYAVLVRGCLQLHHNSEAVELIRAAYKLPSNMSSGSSIVGVEGLEELCTKLKSSGEQAAVEELTAELDQRGLRHRGSRGGKAPVKIGPNRDRNTKSGARIN